MDTIGLELLSKVAEKLYSDSQRLPDVLTGGQAINKRDRVPDYILTQGAANLFEFQLPEPILHPFFQPDVLVVGYYPNYGADEDIPRYGSSFEDYVQFYANQFSAVRRDPLGRPAHRRLSDGQNILIGHYDVVEQLLDEVLGDTQSLGKRAVYCDTIPWKSKDGPARFTSVDGGIAYNRLDDIVFALRPRVVLTLGSRSRDVLIHNQSTPGKTNGRVEVPIVTSYHPAAYGQKFLYHRDEVQTALAEALK